ncbi:hypothetical protein ABT024_33465 [Streptomyces sp. NPDC002812]|uniref:hypothetical protein n=1 Tax=Streptomyces sp. NPDC002812 TaxID=3154434 RepID=UPI003324FA0F
MEHDREREREREPANHYDGFAEAYAAENENSLVNAHYEDPRPDYGATGRYTYDWTFGGKSIPM